MHKKIFGILVLVLMLVFSTTAFASLTFTTDAITGTTASTIDLGVGNNLLLQTSGGNVGIGTATPSNALEVIGVITSDSSLQAPILFVSNVMPLTFNGDIVFKTSTNSERMRVTHLGNVGIGTATPGDSSLLELSSTTKGFVLPRMTKAERDAIVSPVEGMMIYQTDATPGLRVRGVRNWLKFTQADDI